MTPAFSSDVTDYSLSVHSDVASIGIVMTVDPAARSTVLVNNKIVDPGKATNVDIAVGDNSISVAVSGVSHSTTAYTVHVNREDMQPVIDKFLKLSYADTATGITMGYRLFIPADYDSTKPYPLVLFLDGAGGRGGDNEVQLTGTQGATVWAKPEEQAKHPCFVLAPQCPSDLTGKYDKMGWTSLMSKGPSDPYKPRPELETAYHILQDVISKYSIDKNRVYCTGLSMGGFGTWAIAISHPDIFAALVEESGGGDPANLSKVAKLPIWIFHSIKDPTISINFAKSTVSALMKAGGTPRYTAYAEDASFYPSAHLAWVPAYANTEMRDWLFQQSKGP